MTESESRYWQGQPESAIRAEMERRLRAWLALRKVTHGADVLPDVLPRD